MVMIHVYLYQYKKKIKQYKSAALLDQHLTNVIPIKALHKGWNVHPELSGVLLKATWHSLNSVVRSASALDVQSMIVGHQQIKDSTVGPTEAILEKGVFAERIFRATQMHLIIKGKKIIEYC
ncbi:hypothetical protein Y032_0004g2223 [Ancylostoma ceylanicum]|uniref:Uncharacterized protein n=1 Tax=Ancylostoma ceylanicum TaxID=53326 RepID=A0A016VXW8_9BILA|nr:hypothetical protein Y032_0004g2223 [Ancylostoma ceylanicum]